MKGRSRAAYRESSDVSSNELAVLDVATLKCNLNDGVSPIVRRPLASAEARRLKARTTVASESTLPIAASKPIPAVRPTC